jgi:DNA-binding XRE family transcriptional regulator
MLNDKLDSFYRALGERVRTHRDSVQMKQETLANDLGLTRASIINIEKGRHKPNIHTILQIARILNKPYTDFIPADMLLLEQQLLDIHSFKNIVTDIDIDDKALSTINQVFLKSNQKGN